MPNLEIPGNRRIVQISSSFVPANDERFIAVYALCEDGTVWQTERYVKGHWLGWEQLSAIPQEEAK